MNFEDINDLKKMESILSDFSIRLDDNEYDDEEEHESELNKISHDVIREAAKRASELGSLVGSHLYGILLAREASNLEEHSQAQNELQRKAKELVMKAAQLGCWGAKDDLATENVGLLGTSNIEQITYLMLSESSDVQSHIQYCNKHLNANITDAEVAEAAELHDQLIKEMKKNGIEKKSCDCIFI